MWFKFKNEKNLFRSKIALLVITIIVLVFLSTLFLSSFVIDINKKWVMLQTHQDLIDYSNTLFAEYLKPTDLLHKNFIGDQQKFQIFFSHLLKNSKIQRANLFNIEGLIIPGDGVYQANDEDMEIVNDALITGLVSFEDYGPSYEYEEGAMALAIPIKNDQGVTYGVVEIFHVLGDINLHLEQAINAIKLVISGTVSALILFIIFWSIFFYKKLQEKNQQLLAAQESYIKNIELKKVFISIMNHDLKHPLGVVRTAVAMLQENNNSSEQLKHINKIDEMAESMLQMIHDARIFSQLEERQYAEQKAETNLVELLHRTIDNFRTRDYENKKIQIAFRHPQQDCRLFALPILENVFINLIDNAIKYGGDNPVIKVEIVIRQNDFLVSVADNGLGIPDKYKDQIFIRYKRVSGNRDIEGTGLGLAIVKYVIELHSGQVWVEDNSTGGSIFKVTLPYK